MTITLSLCPVCYGEIEARLDIRDGALWMRKTCPTHGETTVMIERDAAFWRACQQPGRGHSRAVYDRISLIEATDRCNLACAHCYHQPDNTIADRPAERIIAKAIATPTDTVCLMGAEPTMRSDLPAIVEGIRAAGKAPLIYSNGIRLADAGLVDALASAGLDGVSLSLHGRSAHGTRIFDKVLKGLTTVLAAGLPLGQISFTLTDTGPHLRQVLAHILDLAARGVEPTDFCIRVPAAIGQQATAQRLYLSDLFAAVNAVALERAIAFAVETGAASNPHHLRVRFGGAPIQLIAWPDVATIDLGFMTMGPWASFIDGCFGSFAHQVILREGLKKGWWQGRRLAP